MPDQESRQNEACGAVADAIFHTRDYTMVELLNLAAGECECIATGAPEEEHITDYQAMALNALKLIYEVRRRLSL